MYTQELINDVLSHSDIVDVISSYLKVVKDGRSFKAVCPFHDDTDPSLKINKEKQIFKCFVCGTGGNAISFVQKYEKISYPAAVRKVAEISGFSDPRLVNDMPKVRVSEDLLRLYSTIDDLQKYYVYGLSTEEGKDAREYLAKRNIPQWQIEKYGIGYALNDGDMTVKYLLGKKHSLKDVESIGIGNLNSSGLRDSNHGRLIFPICSSTGQVVGFSARLIKDIDEAKYRNSSDNQIYHKSELLYNYHRVVGSAHKDGYCYLVEGFMDVMALDSASLGNAVALCGTALTKEHVALLAKLRCEIRLCLDGDNAGQKAIMRSISPLVKAGLSVKVVDYGSDKRDPDEILQEDGPEALKEKMLKLIDPIEFQIGFYKNTVHLNKDEDRVKVLNYFLPFLRNFEPGIIQEDYIAKVADATSFHADAIRAMVRNGQKAQTGLDEHQITKSKAQIHKTESLDSPYSTPRLSKAEKMVLFYMLSEPEAVKYFVNNIKGFYNQVYEDIANFIIDYASSNNNQVDLSGLIASIESSGIENSDILLNRITEVSLEKHLPFESKSLQKYGQVINEEKETISAHIKADKAKSNPDDFGAMIAQIAKARREKWAKSKENKNAQSKK